ncbi:MAG: Cell division protein FtsX [Parcubacteria group bacterium Gr01-1014_72]|nr:MAG: Cell division protein FtsX [Parcubacteria group bacterium Gr01-1014_72]
MLWTNIKRVVKSGFVNFSRNAFVSLSSILIMTVTLSVIGSLLFLSALLDASLTALKNKVDINVYFVAEAPEEEILSLRRSLEALPEVKEIEYVSREEALARFTARHENDELTLQALQELGENPLGAVLNIKAKETSEYEGIVAFLEGEDVLRAGEERIIDDINYNKNKLAIDRLTRIIGASERLGFGVILVLAIISVLITLNTIRLSIYIAREEISVMRLVGASNRYIRGPFVITGILYGLVAGLITLILLYPVSYWLGDVTLNFFNGFAIFPYYLAHFGEFFGIIMGSGVLLGAVSSYAAVRRYLTV